MARILIIDDNAGIGESLGYFLEALGHGVIFAPGGAMGLRCAAEQPIDLVLLDVEMPGMSGFEVCRAMQEDPAMHRIPVVMMTGRGIRELAAPAREAGARLVIAKPFELDHLHKTISRFFPAQPAQTLG